MDIDEGVIGVADLAYMIKRFGAKEHGKVRGMIKRAHKQSGGYGLDRLILDNNSKHVLAHATPGLGDGTYPVYALQTNGEMVGVEAVFLGREVPGWKDAITAAVIGGDA